MNPQLRRQAETVPEEICIKDARME